MSDNQAAAPDAMDEDQEKGKLQKSIERLCLRSSLVEQDGYIVNSKR